MSVPWSPEQQAWLKALGHRVLVLAGEDAVADPLAADPLGESRVAAPARSPTAGEGPPMRGSDAPGVMATTGRSQVADAPERPTPSHRMVSDASDTGINPIAAPRQAPARAPDDALERALLRATGQRTRSEARAVLQRLGVDAQALRGDAEAKRALWRRLRPLRPRFRP